MYTVYKLCQLPAIPNIVAFSHGSCLFGDFKYKKFIRSEAENRLYIRSWKYLMASVHVNVYYAVNFGSPKPPQVFFFFFFFF